MVKKHLQKVLRKFNTENKDSFDYVLTQNERNLPLPGNLFKRFKDSINFKDIAFYPNLNNLKDKIRKYVKHEHIFLTPGSDVGIKTIFELFDFTDGEVLTTNYFFPMYQVYSDIYGATLVKVPYKNFKFNIRELISKINGKTKLIIIANPNSPIGDTYTLEEIKLLLDQGIPTVIDEAYIELSTAESSIELIDKYDNLFVTRTFSKGFGAAGCRVGYICSNKHNIQLLDKLRLMYEISAVSAKYCEFILDNIILYKQYLKDTLLEKNNFMEKLSTSKNIRIFNTDSSWFFLLKNEYTEQFIKRNNISIRTIVLDFMNHTEWYKFNYDLILKQNNIK